MYDAVVVQQQASSEFAEIGGTPYSYHRRIEKNLASLQERVNRLREAGPLFGDSLRRLRTFFRIKNIYHSNAIEGNSLDLGETRLVVEQGLTISGKPLKDTLETRNLARALDLLEDLASSRGQPIRAVEIRQLHQAVLSEIDDENAGAYRKVAVEISGSNFSPPSAEKIAPQMDEFVAWLQSATSTAADKLDPVLLAAAAPAWIVTIHPFLDGNGRTARLLMNLILIRCGYPIAVITREDKFRYYEGLENSQAGGDLTSFVAMILESIGESIEQYEAATVEQREQFEWARSLSGKFGANERDRLQGDYEVWKSGMDLVKSFFHQTARIVTQAALGTARVYFKDFGYLEFEKFLSLRSGASEKKTWFFRLDFVSGTSTARYLFFFGYPSPAMIQARASATLHVAFESGPYFYERLDSTGQHDRPDVVEVGFLPPETFLFRNRAGRVQAGRLEDVGKQFFEQVIARQFSLES